MTLRQRNDEPSGRTRSYELVGVASSAQNRHDHPLLPIIGMDEWASPAEADHAHKSCSGFPVRVSIS